MIEWWAVIAARPRPRSISTRRDGLMTCCGSGSGTSTTTAATCASGSSPLPDPSWSASIGEPISSRSPRPDPATIRRVPGRPSRQPRGARAADDGPGRRRVHRRRLVQRKVGSSTSPCGVPPGGSGPSPTDRADSRLTVSWEPLPSSSVPRRATSRARRSRVRAGQGSGWIRLRLHLRAHHTRRGVGDRSRRVPGLGPHASGPLSRRRRFGTLCSGHLLGQRGGSHAWVRRPCRTEPGGCSPSIHPTDVRRPSPPPRRGRARLRRRRTDLGLVSRAGTRAAADV